MANEHGHGEGEAARLKEDADRPSRRANAQTHGLFSSRSRMPPFRLERLAQLEAQFLKVAKGEEEHECAYALAELQALLEDIRALRVRAWNEAYEQPSTHSERGSAFHVFRMFSTYSLAKNPGDLGDLAPEVDFATQIVLGINDEPRRWQAVLATEQILEHLAKLYRYEQRVLGRRRKVMRRWLRLQCDRNGRDC